MQLLGAHVRANVGLKVKVQKNQSVQMTYTNALRLLAESTQERNFDHIFASIPVFSGTKKEISLIVLKG